MSTTTTVTTLDYVQALYPACTPGALLAYVKVPRFDRLFGYPSGLHRLAERLKVLDRVNDVYLTVNTLDDRAIQARGPYARGEEVEVVSVVAFVADVDAAGKHGHHSPPQSVILDTLADMPLLPSMIVVSGRADGGIHVYWLMAKPVVIRGDEHRRKVKDLSKRWQRLLKKKLAPYELDSTFDLVRVLRPVGTTNKKYGAIVKALSFEPDRRYALADFELCLPAPPAPPMMSLASNLDRGDVAARARAYVARVPGAASGQCGHDATFRVACVLVLDFDLSIDMAWPIMQEWNQTCQPPWSDAELRHKLDNAEAQDGPRGKLLRANADGFNASAIVNAPVVTRLVLSQSEAWL